MLWVLLATSVIWVAAKSMMGKETATVSELLCSIDHLYDGSDLVTLGDIERRINDIYAGDLIGLPIQKVDLKNLESTLDDEPFIAKSHAYLDRSNKLHVELQQRVPILRVIDRNGDNYYLDASGVKLPLSDHFSARVPVVIGYIPEISAWDTTQTVLHDAHALIMNSNDDAFLSAWLESVHLDRHGELSLYGNVGRFAVKLGTIEGIDKKLNNLKNFLQMGGKSLAWNSLESISLEFDGQIITKQKSKV